MKKAVQFALSLLIFSIIISMTMPTDAFAGKKGFYAGIDVGHVKNQLTKRDFVRLLIDGDIALDYPKFIEIVSGIYPGIDDLTAVPSWDELEGTFYDLFKSPDNTGYAIRAHFGYNWKEFVGFEGALFLNSEVTIESDNDEVAAFLRAFNASVACPSSSSGTPDNSCLRFKAKAYVRGFDLLAKIELPAGPFSFYGKAGASYTILEAEGKFSLTNFELGSVDSYPYLEAKVKNDVYDIRKVIAAGVAFRASNELVVNLAYYHYGASGYQPAFDSIMLSMTVEAGGFQQCGDVLC